MAEWTALACNASNQCSPWAPYERFIIVPPAGNPSAPPHQGSVSSRDVTFSWSVRGCANFPEKGRRCSLTTLNRLFTVTAGPAPSGATFTELLLPTYQHPRCTNCHGVNASPSTKPNHHVGSTCSTCHSLGGASNWHAPPATMDFRNKTAAQMCQMTKTLSINIANHLTNDSLILWAVNSGAVPGSALPKAPPSSTSAWHERVEAWLAGGQNCN